MMNRQNRRRNDNEASEVGEAFSLSPSAGERAGVRGKSRVPIDQIHVQRFDATPHPYPTALELGESTALFSLSSDGGGGEGRGEESRFYWISPLPNPLPARSSQGECDRRSTFQCLIQWQVLRTVTKRGWRRAVEGLAAL